MLVIAEQISRKFPLIADLKESTKNNLHYFCFLPKAIVTTPESPFYVVVIATETILSSYIKKQPFEFLARYSRVNLPLE